MQFKQIFLTYLLININKLTISIKLLLKIIKSTKNNNSSRFFELSFDFNSRNRLELSSNFDFNFRNRLVKTFESS